MKYYLAVLLLPLIGLLNFIIKIILVPFVVLKETHNIAVQLNENNLYPWEVHKLEEIQWEQLIEQLKNMQKDKDEE